MINLTPVASSKVKEIMSMQSPVPVALRVAVVGGGCSGFQYHMAFENQTTDADQVFEFDGLKVAVDQDRKSTRLNSSHLVISYAVFCLKKKNIHQYGHRRLEPFELLYLMLVLHQVPDASPPP